MLTRSVRRNPTQALREMLTGQPVRRQRSSRFVWFGLAAALTALFAVEYPELQRYLKMRSM